MGRSLVEYLLRSPILRRLVPVPVSTWPTALYPIPLLDCRRPTKCHLTHVWALRPPLLSSHAGSQMMPLNLFFPGTSKARVLFLEMTHHVNRIVRLLWEVPLFAQRMTSVSHQRLVLNLSFRIHCHGPLDSLGVRMSIIIHNRCNLCHPTSVPPAI